MPKRLGRHFPNHHPFHLNLMGALVNWGCLTPDGEAFVFPKLDISVTSLEIRDVSSCFLQVFSFQTPVPEAGHVWR